MMRIIIISLLLAYALGDGTRSGRDGNKAYESGEYERAATAYREGLRDVNADAVRFALQHNLGASLYRMGNYEEAQKIFASARTEASSADNRARSAYNAGNAALAAGDYAAAADHFRQALLDEPGDADARFNYEYAKRQTPPEDESESSADGDSDSSEEEDESEDSESPQNGDSGEDSQQSQTDPGDDAESEMQEGGHAQNQGEEPDRQPGEAEGRAQRMTPEQAEQILNALQNGEERLLRQIQKAPARPTTVEKDW